MFNGTTVKRYDYGKTGRRVKTTPQGFLRIPASLSRTGVFEYKNGNDVVRELRHPDDVFHEDSVASLKGAVVSAHHQGMVNPNNVNDLSVGFVTDNLKPTSTVINGEVIVQKQDAIDGVKNGKFVELSPGYTCVIVDESGEYEGARYDRRQTHIRYNHVALLPPGGGRQGAEVALHMDSKDAESTTSWEYVEETTSKETIMDKETLRVTFDGVAYEVEVATPLAASFSSNVEKLQTAREDSSKLEGECAALKMENAELQKRLDSAISEEAVQARVNERLTVLKKVEKMDSKIEVEGKDLLTIKKEALVSVGVARETFDGKDEMFVDGMFEAMQQKPAAQTIQLPTPQTTTPRPESRDDAADYDDEAAYERMKARHRDMWRNN